MAKGWKNIPTVNDMEKTEFERDDKIFYKLISKTPKRNLDQLKEHNDETSATCPKLYAFN